MNNLSNFAHRMSSPTRTAQILLAFALMITSGGLQAAAQEKSEHPYIEPGDLKTETCVKCHEDKNKGKFVHSAVAMGCESCHQAASENEKTTITLLATGGDLCMMCHEAAKAKVVHGPYANGQCLTCHDPHQSDFKAQTRAETNTLCLGCHQQRRVTTKEVKLFTTQELPEKEFAAIPKIGLDPTQRFGHPWATHPVAGIDDPLNTGQKMTCLSCHVPHASDQTKLIRASADAKLDVCDSCHQAVEKQNDEAARLKAEKQTAQTAKEDKKQP